MAALAGPAGTLGVGFCWGYIKHDACTHVVLPVACLRVGGGGCTQGVLLAGCADEEEWQHLLDLQLGCLHSSGARDQGVGMVGVVARVVIVWLSLFGVDMRH